MNNYLKTFLERGPSDWVGREQITLRVGSDKLVMADELAEGLGVTRTDILREILETELETMWRDAVDAGICEREPS